MSTTAATAGRVFVFSPVYFDVPCYLRLIEDVGRALSPLAGDRARFVMIDDSAGVDPDVAQLASDGRVKVVTPPFSLGHQRAIVYGLRKLSAELEPEDVVVTMDADGEDRPVDLPSLLRELLAAPSTPRKVVLARRTSRHVTWTFRLLYFFFAVLFRSLTGTLIRTGNYAAYKAWIVKRVLSHPHFDLCYSASLVSLNLDVRLVPCPRGRRYAGSSKMGPFRLVRHGFSMMMPFLDRIAVRALIAFTGVLGLALGWALVAALVVAFGHRAVPEWAIGVIAFLVCFSVVAFGNLVVLFSLYAQAQGAALRRLEDVDPYFLSNPR